MKNGICYKSVSVIFVSAFVLLSFTFVDGQTWNSNAGGYNGGYGQVYSTWGLANATQNMEFTMKMAMQRSMARIQMEKQFGKKRTAEAIANANKYSNSTNSRQKQSANVNVEKPRVVNNYGVFKPVSTVDTGKLLADTLSETPEEKALLKRIYTETKNAFEKQVAGKGWKNNIAGGLTFFIVTSATVYHDTPEPSDETVDALYNAINESIDEIPKFGKLPDQTKQEFYNKMIGFSGLLLAGYTEGKQEENAETLAAYKQLSGILIELVLKINPDNMSFKNGGFEIK